MTVWVGVVAALVGAIVGGGIAVLNSSLHWREQRSRERKRLLLSKLEELHEVLSQFKEAYRAPLHERILSTHDVDTMEHMKSLSQVPIERLRMLVGFYASTIMDHLDRLEGAQRNFSRILIKSVRLEQGDQLARKEALTGLFAEERKVRRACTDMQTEVIRLSKQCL
jgi:hypothetical protein